MTSNVVFALDLATRTGFAVGAAGEKPRSGVVVLKKPNEHRSEAFWNLTAWLQQEWSQEKPHLVVKEAPFNLQAFADKHNSQAGVQLAYGFHGIVEGLARGYGIPCEDAYPSAIRKFFLGRARLGTRAETKAAVVARCHLLRLIPADCDDDNRADAVATFEFACATHFRRSMTAQNFRLFGERANA